MRLLLLLLLLPFAALGQKVPLYNTNTLWMSPSNMLASNFIRGPFIDYTKGQFGQLSLTLSNFSADGLTFVRSNGALITGKIGLGNASVYDVLLQTLALNQGLVNNGTLWTNVPMSGYTIVFVYAVGASPADATVYYFGADCGTGSTPATTYANQAFRIKNPGVVRGLSIFVRVAGTLGSNETVSHYLRLNDTTDFAQIDINYASAATNQTVSASQVVAAGDTITGKLAATTWATNPTSVRPYWCIHIDPL